MAQSDTPELSAQAKGPPQQTASTNPAAPLSKLELYGDQPTNALTIDTATFVDPFGDYDLRAVIDEIGDSATDEVPGSEVNMMVLEAQIVIWRCMLAAGKGNILEIEADLAIAGPRYDAHLKEMLQLKHINAKIKQPPKLPITFTLEEISELFWTLVQFGSLDPVVVHAEKTLQDNRARIVLSSTSAERGAAIREAVGEIDAALEEWRAKANAAVHGRCVAVEKRVFEEILKKNEGGVAWA